MTPTMGCVLMGPRSTGDKINKDDNLRLLHTKAHRVLEEAFCILYLLYTLLDLCIVKHHTRSLHT